VVVTSLTAPPSGLFGHAAIDDDRDAGDREP
jgi:hypothetical protein